MDIMKMLNDINPSPKTMKYIIVILCSIIVGLFSYDKFVPKDDPKYTEKIQKLEHRLTNLANNQDNINANIESLDIKTNDNFTTLKTYVDSRVEFIIINQNNKNKELVLSLLKLNSNINFEKSVIRPAFISTETQYKSSKKIEDVERSESSDKPEILERSDSNENLQKLDTVVNTQKVVDDSIVNEPATDQNDSIDKPIVKKGIFNKIKNIFSSKPNE
jgi:hypothetical protein